MSDTRIMALKQALKMETDGMTYYQAARDKATSELGRNMFDFLRSSEEGHIARIHEIFRTLQQGGSWPAPPTVVVDEQARLKTVFADALELIRVAESVDASDLEALQHAADFERSGEGFYRQRAAAVVDPFEKAFYEQLAREEFHHLDAINDSIQLLEDPQGFFADREPGTMSGV